jgi:hypothetical protein
VRPYVKEQARQWWGVPIIPGIQEAEIGRLWCQAGLGKKHKILSEKITKENRDRGMA